jgi:hypothetical protein
MLTVTALNINTCLVLMSSAMVMLTIAELLEGRYYKAQMS